MKRTKASRGAAAGSSLVWSCCSTCQIETCKHKLQTHTPSRGGGAYFEREDWTDAMVEMIQLTHSCLLPALGVTGVNWSQSQLSLLSVGRGRVTPLEDLTQFTVICQHKVAPRFNLELTVYSLPL